MSRDALVVGINTYQHLPSLQAPAQDAESVARCLESFGECRVVRLPEVITQQKPAIGQRGSVTTPLLEDALIKLFKPAGKTIPQTAIFYYSGHGLQRQAGIQEGYLATSDANPAAGHYGLSLHWLRRLLQESPVRQRVILLDCCNSGEFFNMLEADPGASAGTDRLFMAAAREYESAYEALDSNHSVFTQALLCGLNPYKVKGGIVNSHSLTDVVNRELKGELQQPLFESSGSEIVLTRMSGMTAPSRDTSPPLLERLQKLRYGFCPFPGAAPFEAVHSEFFFGRDEITQTLVQRVQSSRLCALVGASGSGKTSLLRAGLMPGLAKAEGETVWDVRYLALGASPLASVAEVLVDPGATGLQRAEQLHRAESFLRQGPEGFCQLVQALTGGQEPETRLVVVLDQFETLLTPDLGSDGDRRLILDGLTAAVQQDHLPFHLVLGLRAHHLDRLTEFAKFRALVVDHSLTLPTMTYNQLKATIVGPLDRAGFRYDANLVYTLLLDVVSAPADLALLQLVLKELWSRREDNPNAPDPPRLTLAAYVEMGGIRQLLNQRASDLYQSFSVSEQAIAQRIFLGLCDLGDGATLSRRQISLLELVTEAMPQEAVVATLDQLLAARLVVAQAVLPDLDGDPSKSDRDPSAIAVPGWSSSPGRGDGKALVTGALTVASLPGPPDTPYFDIAHEALLRNWPLLQQWLQSQGPWVKQQRAIEVAAQGWHPQRPNHPDCFLTQTRLGEAKLFQQAHPEHLSLQASRYLSACDRHNRRCSRQRYLVGLLIPLSMATGMLTAYSHSYLTQSEPGQARGQGAPARTVTKAAVAMPMVPSFELVAPTPPPDSAAPTLGSPRAGMVGTGVLNLAPGSRRTTASQPQRLAAPAIQGALAQAAQGLEPLAATAKVLQPTQVAGAPLPAAPPLAAAPSLAAAPTPARSLPPGPSTSQSLPSANQVVRLESSWISPDDPAVVIQVWCTYTEAEPVCFTSTAARSD